MQEHPQHGGARPARALAFDLGASSGRAILAEYAAGRLQYTQVHRFENQPVERGGTLFWDFSALLREIRLGMEKAGRFDSLGFDTWGVDFGLLGENGRLLQDPVHYRDKRTAGICEEAFARMPPGELYRATGNQIMPINTLFQLLALRRQAPALLQRAKTLLFMPDLLAYTLCGRAVCERSIASTSQLLDPAAATWSGEVLRRFCIPRSLLAPLVPSGTVIGRLAGGEQVIAVAGHDTQCAVAALPAEPREAERAAFLSCGTWSLLGTELDSPVLTGLSQELGLSNELGANGKINYLKNIIGLWLIQESRRAWRRQGREYSYAQLEALALEAPPFACFIDPDAPEFAPPGDIPARVREFCRRTRQQVPETAGEVVRCIYESLALKYRFALGQLARATGKRFEALHILGGGAKDGLLCQMAASCCGLPVKAGPVEATALGNLLIQLTALGRLPNLDAGRSLLAQTETIRLYPPGDPAPWNRAFERYQHTILKGETEYAVS